MVFRSEIPKSMKTALLKSTLTCVLRSGTLTGARKERMATGTLRQETRFAPRLGNHLPRPELPWQAGGKQLLPHSNLMLKGRPWPRPRRGLFLNPRPGGGERTRAKEAAFRFPACKRPRSKSPALEIARDGWRNKNTSQLSAQAEAIEKHRRCLDSHDFCRS